MCYSAADHAALMGPLTFVLHRLGFADEIDDEDLHGQDQSLIQMMATCEHVLAVISPNLIGSSSSDSDSSRSNGVEWLN